MAKIQILISLLGGLLIALIITYWAPYPYIHDTDVFRHTLLVNKILAGEFIWGQSAYLAISHYFIALLSILFGLKQDPYILFWATRFIIYPLYSLGTFLFIKQAVKNKHIALFVSFLAPLITIEFLSLINFAPKILSLIILPYLLYWIIKAKKINWFIITAIIIISLLAHVYMGLINLFVIFSYLFFKKYFNKKIILVFIVIPILYIVLQFLDIFSLSGLSFSIFGEADLRKFNFDFYLQRFFEYFPVLIIPLTLLGAILRKNDKNIISFLPALFWLVAIYFSPFNASFRVLASALPLIILLIAIFIEDFPKLISNKNLQKVFLSITVLVLLFNFTIPYFEKIKKSINIPQNKNNFTILSPREHQAADWIQENIDEPSIIVSDPINSIALAALSQNNAVYPAEQIMEQVMTRTKAKKTYNFLQQEQLDRGQKILIYIDGRTSFWVRNKDDQEIFYAPNQDKKFKEFEGFSKFLDEQYFNILYEQNHVYLLELI